MKKTKLLLIITLLLSFCKTALAIVTVTIETDKSFGVVPLQVRYTADVDLPLFVTNYEWDLNGDGFYETSGASESTAVRIYNTSGIYYPKVRVWDSFGSTSVDSAVIYALESTNILNGTVSGYINLSSGTYRISSDIIIDSGAVLGIEPGAILRFDENRYFKVKGNAVLIAGGDGANAVVFSSLTQKNWAGFIFDSFSLGYFENSVIEKANHGVKAGNYSTVSVFNSEIRNNGMITEDGGGIYLSDNSYVVLFESNIYNNKAKYGGAFYNNNGNLFLDSCSVSYNSAILGSGFYNTGNYDTTIAIYCNFIYDTGTVDNDFFVNKSINGQSAFLNWWNTSDNTLIDKSIYDNYDSAVYGIVDHSLNSELKYNLKNFLPVVAITSNYDSGNAPLTVAFTAKAEDYDGNISNYEWDCDGDGVFDSSVSESTFIYIYSSPDTYLPKVRVTDNNGAKASVSKIISVTSFSIPLDFDTTAPAIEGTALFGLLNNGEDSYVTVTVKDNIALRSGEFLVNKNGKADNAFVSIFKQEGLAVLALTKTVKIPKEYITPAGLAYKIIAYDLANNKKEITGYLRVKVTDYNVSLPTWTWKMISFPLILDSASIDSALGPLENRRVYRWNPVNKEYSKTYDVNIDPGDAFWFKIKEDNIPDPFTIKVNGVSVDPGNVPNIILPPGWSQIADPYAYKIASSKIKVKQDNVEIYVSDTANAWLENQFMTYDLDSTSGKRSYIDLTNISSNTGFWVKNRSDKDITIIFPKYDAEVSGAMVVNSPFRKVKNDGWGLKLKVMSKSCIDTDNYLGFIPGAKKGYDYNDLSEPPPVDNYVSLYFPHFDWEKDNGRYRTDYRACGDYGIMEITNYDFIIETNAKDKTTIIWDIINPPLNYRVMLYDKKEDKKVDMANIKEYAFDWPAGNSKRDFSIIIEWDNIYLMNSIEVSDINLNNIIDGEDLSILGNAFGKTQGENNWNPKADLNKDSIIDGSDLYILGKSFGGNY